MTNINFSAVLEIEGPIFMHLDSGVLKVECSAFTYPGPLGVILRPTKSSGPKELVWNSVWNTVFFVGRRLVLDVEEYSATQEFVCRALAGELEATNTVAGSS